LRLGEFEKIWREGSRQEQANHSGTSATKSLQRDKHFRPALGE